MTIIFYDKNDNKIFDIVNINDSTDISFKEDRIYIYGQGHHYSEFLYDQTIVDTSLVNMSLLTDFEDFIIKNLEKRFDFEYVIDEDKAAAWMLVSMFWLVIIPIGVIGVFIDHITDKLADYWRLKHHGNK